MIVCRKVAKAQRNPALSNRKSSRLCALAARADKSAVPEGLQQNEKGV
jgi:hypothetical protein